MRNLKRAAKFQSEELKRAELCPAETPVFKNTPSVIIPGNRAFRR